MRTVILVPMLGRAHLVSGLLSSIRATCDARVLWLVTPGDRTVLDAIAKVGGEILSIPYRSHGDYARKINTGYRHTREELIFCGAIDLHFHPSWLEAACAQLAPGIGVVGTNDLGSPRVLAGEHSTHSLVTREYADRYGTIDRRGEIMHEGYIHEFVDDELVCTAKHRGAWAFAANAHVEHLHPDWDKAPTDALYNQQRSRMKAGAGLYRRRRRLWR